MTRAFQQPWSLAIGCLLALQASATPSVNVGMNAAFRAGPYLLELLETAAGENSSAYFPLLDRIAGGYFTSASTDAMLYAKFLDVLRIDGHITSPEALSTFNLALSLRSAAPRIEAHYQYYSTAVEPATRDALSADCVNWVYFEGKQYCTPALDKQTKNGLFPSEVKHLPFDRTLGVGREAVLYADLTSATFGSFHEPLSKAAKQGALRYRLRYRQTEDDSLNSLLPISGYGVELALKRTDYIVIDDRAAGQDPEQKPLNSEATFDDDKEVADLKPLSKSELSSLGLKASSFILRSEDPFETLVKLTQDLPKNSASIAAHNASDKFVGELQKNALQGVPSGINLLWVNGVQLIERQIEPFALIGILRRERRLIDGFRALGLGGKQAVSLLGHEEVANAKADDEPLRYDWTDRLEGGRVLIWLNDLENDDRYSDYAKDLTSLLQRTLPGQLPPVARNTFILIAPVDISDSEDLAFVFQLTSFVHRGVPIRIGLVPLASTPEAISHAKMLYHLSETYGTDSLATYLQELQKAPQKTADEKLLASTVENREPLLDYKRMTSSEVLEADSYKQQVKLARRWTNRLRAGTSTRPVFINGLALPRDENWMQAMSMRINEDLHTVQKGVFHGIITEDTWVPGVFLNKAATRRNTYITSNGEKDLWVLDINKFYRDHADFFFLIPILESLSESTKESWAVVTVLADMTASDGQTFVLSALNFKRNNPGVRMELVHNPRTTSGAAAVNAVLKANEKALSELDTLTELENLFKAPAEEDVDENNYHEALEKFLSDAKALPGTQMAILNGRVIGPISSDSPFDADDFQQLFEFEQTSRILPVYAAMNDLGLRDKLSDPLAVAKITSIIALSTISDLPEGIFESTPAIRSNLFNAWYSTHTAIEAGDEETASIHVIGLLNPVSEQGQRWAPILKILSELDGVYLKLLLNPKERIEELPVKRFFRYVLQSHPSFNEDGKVKRLEAAFKGLPSEALLTTAMDVPPAWLVTPQISAHDLDNIKLSSIKSDVFATYELKHILIEGHSREGGGSPPRGAQLVLATETDPLLTDTLIMSNLGFFQFKANPGIYNIQLKEGRSADIYDIESIGAQGWNPVPGDNGTELALMDFQGTTLYPRLKRRPGMEKDDVLEKGAARNDNIVSKGIKFAEFLFGGGSKTTSVLAEEHAEINIFSVASGHLYERMLNIMMVSVMRHTKHTVKFWFIEQFLSPSFKDFIPHLAREYGFRYEMISYKWPHWLRQQREKQREIWGYKILFLDVLFPLSLDKVIFVDADQIVRTDMLDLVNHDLQGAPYGFTPMCDSRVEMEGFRFWKQGYWANYLRGHPYHISALYVVDLRRFREVAAGDRLRQQYHSLSADPGSLANLDQDLPNHMQFQIPIHSLPQEWLWCETWCSDESLTQARTIDLCNNPQTKEPKLDRARRQVPEWTVYDNKIAALNQWRKGLKPTTSGGDGTLSQDENSKVGQAKERETNTKSRRFEDDGHTVDEL